MKRKWKRPELVVLFKGRPEENVLMHCKAGQIAGPDATQNFCKVPEVCTVNCDEAPTS